MKQKKKEKVNEFSWFSRVGKFNIAFAFFWHLAFILIYYVNLYTFEIDLLSNVFVHLKVLRADMDRSWSVCGRATSRASCLKEVGHWVSCRGVSQNCQVNLNKINFFYHFKRFALLWYTLQKQPFADVIQNRRS